MAYKNKIIYCEIVKSRVNNGNKREGKDLNYCNCKNTKYLMGTSEGWLQITNRFDSELLHMFNERRDDATN